MGGHRNLEYAFWANEQSFGSAVLLIIGGLIGAVPYVGFNGEAVQFRFYWAGIYSMIVGIIVLVIEYPRGKRMKGSVVERRYQQSAAKFVTALGPLTRNYFSRFIFYFLMSVPACVLITTFLGGVGLAIGSLIYLTSAIKGEQWRSPGASASRPAAKAGKSVPAAPNNPPPRRPVDANGHEQITLEVAS